MRYFQPLLILISCLIFDLNKFAYLGRSVIREDFCGSALFTKINRSVGSVFVFQQNEPQNHQKIVTLMNNKVVINNLILESKFLTFQNQPQELGDCDLCVEFAHFLSNFITLERKRKLTKTKTLYLAII